MRANQGRTMLRSGLRFLRTLCIAAALCAAISPWAVAAPITGNTGPGGFEATNAASSLLYWLRADSLSAGNISAWNDQRTFSPNNFTQSDPNRLPVFSGAGMNGRPAVTFDGANQPLDDRLTLGTSTNPQSFVIVANSVNNK